MKRHRKVFDPKNENPFEISRSKVENFIRCPACFWLDKVKGVKFPSIPPFNINSNTDKLLKRDFDSVRGIKTHPILEKNGLGHLIPFEHDDLDKWISSLHFGAKGYFHTVHQETNILLGGGLDDIIMNTNSGELHIVDFKSTSNQSKDPKPVNLYGDWKMSYKRQMDMYIWILRRMGYPVNDIGYFIYVDGLHVGINGMIDDDPSMATMKFATSVLPYESNTGWIEPTLHRIKETLLQDYCPEHSSDCEEGNFIKQVGQIMSVE